MSSTAQVVPSKSDELEAAILKATTEASSIVSEFSPAIGKVIGAGVAVEPVVSGFARLLVGLFHHHTKVQPKQ